jgi:predicted  nucleic acid-binding Zn-ribbon protein
LALSIPEQIHSLENLAAIDAELKILDDQLTQERSTLATLKATLKRHEDKLKSDTLSIAATEKARNELVADVRAMMQQLDHSREKLNRSRTERESNAAQRELEELRKLVRDREDDITKLTSEGDAVRTQMEATEAEAKKVQTELGSSEGDINSRVGEVEQRKAAKLAEREVAMKSLPPVLYRRYDMIRGKKGVGIAQTTDGTCKACNMALSPQLFHRLRREPMIEQCPSCQRLIYFVPPPPQAAVSES